MDNYMDAYTARIKRNAAELEQLIKDVQESDASIEAYVYKSNPLIRGVVFIRGEEINSIHFHEVPYRWSGCGYSEFGNSHWGGKNAAMPFTAEDVLTTFKPISSKRKSSIENYKDKEAYLKWCSYLHKYEEHENSEKSNAT